MPKLPKRYYSALSRRCTCQWAQKCQNTSFREWELHTCSRPSRFYSVDMLTTRCGLHEEGIVPEVRLSGPGEIITLRWIGCVTHALPQNAEVCLEFLGEITKVRSHSAQYRAESIASFNQRVFDELCKVDFNHPLRRHRSRKSKRDAVGGAKCAAIPTKRSIMQWLGAAKVKMSCGTIGAHASLALNWRRTTTHRRCMWRTPTYMSRFDEETWTGFVCSRKPSQVVCNLHEQLPDMPILTAM